MQKQAMARLPDTVEWPTLGLALGIYAGFGGLTWFYQALPWWFVLGAGAYLVSLHGSLQHEVLHGHPTPWGWINETLIFPSLWLWMPYRVYREHHLRHHQDEDLTDPMEDPESYYVTPDTWRRIGWFGRAFLWAHNTVTGRLLLGPAYSIGKLFYAETMRLIRGDTSQVKAWLLHGLGSALTLGWVLWICGVPLVDYLVLFAYPGISLTLLRSFLEHQARPRVGERIAIVEAGPLFSTLFLNNNLHALHHAEPGRAWYDLPKRFRAHRDELLAANGGYRYSGYTEVILRYLFWPKEHPVHPLMNRPANQSHPQVEAMSAAQ